MKKKILIFGATGFIGAYLTDYCKQNLDAEMYEVIAVGRRKTDFFDRLSIPYIQLDVLNQADFDKL